MYRSDLAFVLVPPALDVGPITERVLPGLPLVLFLVALLAPLLFRVFGRASGWVLAIVPAAIASWSIGVVAAARQGVDIVSSTPWVADLGIHLAYRLDGLALLFLVLITGIGALVLVFTGGYLAAHPGAGRLYGLLFFFMGSMVGIVLADDLILLFVYWELTSISSYFLIGFDHADKKARAAAQQALIVTSIGGLALLASFLLLRSAAGTTLISAVPDGLGGRGAYPAIVLLLFLGAFTKSAQVPFHFWLPHAMVAPTPVSTYLHAATMVKAGVYLVARFHGSLGGTLLWSYPLLVIGGMTMLLGAYQALHRPDIKEVLAYTTTSALGLFMMLLGVGSPLAIAAMLMFLTAHALYKGALFMVAGILEQTTGTRDLGRLTGLGRSMPLTAGVAILAASALAGLPPTFGFLGKESVLDALLEGEAAALGLLGATVISLALLVVAAYRVGVRPFVGDPEASPRPSRKTTPALVLGPLVLAALGLFFGLWPAALGSLLADATSAITGAPIRLSLALWHGVTPTLLLSALVFATAALVYPQRGRIRRAAAELEPYIMPLYPSRVHDRTMRFIMAGARFTTRRVQTGILREELFVTLIVVTMLVGTALVFHDPGGIWAAPRDVLLHEGVLVGIIVAAAVVAVTTRSRVAAIVALGVIGDGMALVFLLFGAPDLAMAQFLIETLLVLLLALLLVRFPRWVTRTKTRTKIRDGTLAGAIGLIMGGLTFLVARSRMTDPVSGYFADNAWTQGHGRNVVNTILIDFRALDTLGEITVLAIAAIGSYALLRRRRRRT